MAVRMTAGGEGLLRKARQASASGSMSDSVPLAAIAPSVLGNPP